MGMGMLNLGLGMGINNWEWEEMGLKKIFPLISSLGLLDKNIGTSARFYTYRPYVTEKSRTAVMYFLDRGCVLRRHLTPLVYGFATSCYFHCRRMRLFICLDLLVCISV